MVGGGVRALRRLGPWLLGAALVGLGAPGCDGEINVSSLTGEDGGGGGRDAPIEVGDGLGPDFAMHHDLRVPADLAAIDHGVGPDLRGRDLWAGDDLLEPPDLAVPILSLIHI